MTRRVQAFVKVIKTENSLYLINEDRTFFSLFLGVQSAPEWVAQVTKHPVYFTIVDILFFRAE